MDFYSTIHILPKSVLLVARPYVKHELVKTYVLQNDKTNWKQIKPFFLEFVNCILKKSVLWVIVNLYHLLQLHP